MSEGVQLRLTHLGRVLPSPPYLAGTVRDTSLYIDDLRRESQIRGGDTFAGNIAIAFLEVEGVRWRT
jgi:hypothetical protein